MLSSDSSAPKVEAVTTKVLRAKDMDKVNFDKVMPLIFVSSQLFIIVDDNVHGQCESEMYFNWRLDDGFTALFWQTNDTFMSLVYFMTK